MSQKMEPTFHLTINIDPSIICQCGGYYDKYTDDSVESYLQKPSYRCNKCGHKIKLELGHIIRNNNSMFSENKTCFNVIPNTP